MRWPDIAGYIHGLIVNDNTRDPLTRKFMVQTFGQYNVEVLFVRFIQLYSLSKLDPAKYPIKFINSMTSTTDYIKILLLDLENYMIAVDDLPKEVELHSNDTKIIPRWSLENRKDKLFELSLDENTGLIRAHFYNNGTHISKSSVWSTEYLTFEVMRNIALKEERRSRILGNGKHVRTEGGGYHIKPARR